jgi:hypothetical protein
MFLTIYYTMFFLNCQGNDNDLTRILTICIFFVRGLEKSKFYDIIRITMNF